METMVSRFTFRGGTPASERLWRTLQDRLTSELRLRHIASAAGANAFLPEFLALDAHDK